MRYITLTQVPPSPIITQYNKLSTPSPTPSVLCTMWTALNEKLANTVDIQAAVMSKRNFSRQLKTIRSEVVTIVHPIGWQFDGFLDHFLSDGKRKLLGLFLDVLKCSIQ